MPKYAATLQRGTASATLSVGSLIGAASSVRRLKLVEFEVGSEATPADVGILWQIQRCTTTSTGGTGVTPQALDPGDTIAATAVVNQAPTADPTLTANAILFSQPVNQRAGYRWVANPGYELITPATASNGLAFRTPTLNGGTPALTLHTFFEE